MQQDNYDKRKNLIGYAYLESKWSILTINNLPKDLQILFKDYVIKKDQKYNFDVQDRPSFDASIKHWLQYELNNKSRKTKFESLIESKLSHREENLHRMFKSRSFIKHRGRVRASDSPTQNDYAGIMERKSPHDKEFKGFWPSPQYHAKDSYAPDMKNPYSTAILFQNTGAPFIAGASGTLEYVILDLYRGIEDGREYKEVDFEKIILIFTVGQIAAGNHSLSECILTAQAFGLFSGTIDPRKDYEALLRTIGIYCEKYNILPPKFNADQERHHARHYCLTM